VFENSQRAHSPLLAVGFFNCGNLRNLWRELMIEILHRTGSQSNVVMIRILPGSDIIEGVEAACRELHIHTGAITCCIGSLQRASFLIAVPLENKMGAGYSEPRILDGPLEFLSGQGMVGKEEDGSLFIHLHGVLSDKNGKVCGGHLVKGENPVLITCEIMLAQVEGVRMMRIYDPQVDMKLLKPLPVQ
jgi:predicted DNA-binding protein with PD1-like motif